MTEFISFVTRIAGSKKRGFKKKKRAVLILRNNILYHIKLLRIGWIKTNSALIIHIFRCTIYIHKVHLE